MLLGGDVVVIEIENSPLFDSEQEVLQGIVSGFASEAIKAAGVPLESLIMTIYRNEMTDNPENYRQFIFLVEEDQPVLYDDAMIESLPSIESLINPPEESPGT